jgi:Lysylphosphatidylglycerol synthase TM region
VDSNGPSATVTGRRIPPALLLALRVIGSALVIGAFLWAFAGQAGELASHSWQIAPLWLFIAFVCALARGPLIVYPWWRIVYAWGYGFDWWRGVRVYFHSGLARYIPGQYWFVLTRALLAEREGVPRRVTAASTLVETILVTGAAGGVALLGMQRVPGWPESTRWLFLLGGIIAPLLLVALVASTPASRVWGRLARLLKYDLPRPRLAWEDASWVVVASYGNWALYGLVAAFSLAGVAGDPGAYLANFPAIMGCFCASVLGAAVVLFVPQGIVVREGVFVFLLHALLSVPIPEAIAAAALTRLIATIAEGIWAVISLRF